MPWSYSENSPPSFAVQGFDPSRCSKETEYSKYNVGSSEKYWIQYDVWQCWAPVCVLEEISDLVKEELCNNPEEPHLTCDNSPDSY